MKLRTLPFVFAALCSAFALYADDLLPYTVKSMKMEGKYWKGQKIKGTEKGLGENSGKTAEENGWIEIHAFAKFNDAKTLSDGNLSAGIRTYAWSNHGKRITIIADLGGVKDVERVAVGQHPFLNELIERIEVYPATEKKDGEWQWQDPVSATQEELQINHQERVGSLAQTPHYFVNVTVGQKAAALKIVCSNYKPLELVLTEIQIFGRHAK